jgi:hypothetical protein
MAARQGNGELGGRPKTGPHEEFLELCAFSTTGELTEEERARLDAHLEACPECRHAMKEFDAVMEIGAPLVASELAAITNTEPKVVPSVDAAAVGVESPAVALGRAAPEVTGEGRELGFAGRVGHPRTRLNWNFVWVPLAAAVVLMVAFGIYSYQIGKRRGLEAVRIPSNPVVADTRLGTLEQQISDVDHEREVLRGQLADRDRVVADLRRQIELQAATLSEMKLAQASLEHSAAINESEKQQVAQERGNLTQKLDTAQAALLKMQGDLDSLRQQRSLDEQRSASLQAQIRDLSGQLREREQTIGRQGELLAHDRDIRDLMGARDLYIAEVYDVARNGATQKPYGRVFYTKGKSLVFYAYDLDQQAGMKNASTFQAWGRRGPDKEQALNLGIFYADSAAKKRWVLKFDDPQMLAQIDAVFVTVEPNGGSHKPSGKALLFAYLKVDPNHP